MNLIEAIKSGRPIRRKNRATWNRPEKNYICDPTQDHWFDPRFYLETVGVTRDDLLADDWEVQEPKVTITRTQFWKACEAVALKCGAAKDFDQLELARRLGLED